MEEAFFRERFGRTAVRGAIFGLLCIGLGAFLAWLYFKDPDRGDSPPSARIAVFALLALFFLSGLRFLWISATSGPRRRRLLRILDEEPERVARIYTAVMRSRPGVHRQVIPPPEAENMPPAPGGYHIVVELKEPSRLERLLGNHKHAVIARAEDIPALLAWLRAKAPSAEGPPAF